MQVRTSDLRVMKILSDEGDRVVAEITKTDDVTFSIEEGAQFLTILFVHEGSEPGTMEVWDPFQT